MSKKDYVRTIARSMLSNVVDFLIFMIQVGVLTQSDALEIINLMKEDITERMK